jgi:hypothetical protein
MTSQEVATQLRAVHKSRTVLSAVNCELHYKSSSSSIPVSKKRGGISVVGREVSDSWHDCCGKFFSVRRTLLIYDLSPPLGP